MSDITVPAARLLVVRHLRDRLRRSVPLSGVVVSHGWPAEDELMDEMLWAGPLSGEDEIPAFVGAGTRQIRDDQFTIDWYARVAGQVGVSAESAKDATHSRLAVLLGEIELVVADDPTLDDQITLIDATLASVDQDVVGTTDGPIGFGHLALSCHSRLD